MKDIAAGVILSGGKNSRMNGRNKAFIEVGGTTLIQRALMVFKELFNEVILVTNSPSDYEIHSKECLIVCDRIKNIGPLGGIHAGLSVAVNKNAFFMAIDMPFLHNELIMQQLDFFKNNPSQALVPRVGDFIQPLHAIYQKSVCDIIDTYVKTAPNYSLRRFLKAVNTKYFELEDTEYIRKAFCNLNTPDDIEKINDYEDQVKNMV